MLHHSETKLSDDRWEDMDPRSVIVVDGHTLDPNTRNAKRFINGIRPVLPRKGAPFKKFLRKLHEVNRDINESYGATTWVLICCKSKESSKIVPVTALNATALLSVALQPGDTHNGVDPVKFCFPPIILDDSATLAQLIETARKKPKFGDHRGTSPAFNLPEGKWDPRKSHEPARIMTVSKQLALMREGLRILGQ